MLNQGVLNDNVGEDADAMSNPEEPQATALEVRADADPVLLDASSLPSEVKKTAVDLGVDIRQVLCTCRAQHA